MIGEITSVFALVLAVVASGAAALTISACARIARRMDSTQVQLTGIEQRLLKTHPTTLQVEVDDLRAALDKHRASMRKELGSLWGKRGGGRHNDSPDDDDDELSDLIRLQAGDNPAAQR